MKARREGPEVARQAVDLRAVESGATPVDGKPEPSHPEGLEAESRKDLAPTEVVGGKGTLHRLAAAGGSAWHWTRDAAKALEAALGVVRTFVVNIALIIGVGFAIAAVVDELLQRRLIFEPVHLPKGLVDIGYTPESVARQLKQQIQRIREESTTLKKDLSKLREAGEDLGPEELQKKLEQLNIPIPVTDTTLRQVVDYLRTLLPVPPERRITGEIIGDEEIGYELRLWSDDWPAAPRPSWRRPSPTSWLWPCSRGS
jgi:hypothetical protein